MDEHKPLYISPKKKIKGLKIFCYECGTLVNGVCKKTGKDLSTCKFGDKQRYKVIVHVPGTKNERKVRILETRDYDEAVKQALEFQKEVKEGKAPPVPVPVVKPQVQSKTYSLTGLMSRYVGYLNGDPEIVPEYKRKVRSKSHLWDVEKAFKTFAIALKKNGYDVNALRVDEVDEAMLGKLHEYLTRDLQAGNATYNRTFTVLTSFYNYLNSEGYQLRNPFASVPRKAIASRIETISKDEYDRLLEIVQKPELGIQKLGKGVEKNLYKPWVKDAIELGLNTGRRNEEIARMKWNEVYEDEQSVPQYIRVPDFKVNRQKGNTEDNLKYIYVPVTDELNDLLERIGYGKYKHTDKYILAPEEEMERNTIRKFFSRSFTHYYKQLHTGRNLNFKVLRKTYITQLTKFMGMDNAQLITKHSGTEVMKKHYIDQKTIAEAAKNFKMFGEKKGREEEVKKIRKRKESVREKENGLGR